MSTFQTTTEAALITRFQQRTTEASEGILADWDSGNPLNAVIEGFAASGAELSLELDRQLNQLSLLLLNRLGLPRVTGVRAVGTFRFQLDSIFTTPFIIPSGYLFSVGDQKIETTQLVNIPALLDTTQALNYPQCSVPVQAVEIGSQLNQWSGQATITSPINGLAAIVSVGKISGGLDTETDSSYLKRVQDVVGLAQRIIAGTANPYVPMESIARDFLGASASILVRGGVRPDLSTENPAVTVFALNPDGSSLNAVQLGTLAGKIKAAAIGIEGSVYAANLTLTNLELKVFVFIPPASSNATAATAIRDSVLKSISPGAWTPGDDIRLYSHVHPPIWKALDSLYAAQYTKGSASGYGITSSPIGALGGALYNGDLALGAIAVPLIKRLTVTVTSSGVDQSFVYNS